MNNSAQIAVEGFAPVQWIKTLNALFLIAGTCIGGGMLALPISSSPSGFWPSILIMFIACVFMTLTGLLFLEATLWMKKESHVISLSKEFLNKFGQTVCWIVYLFIGYASLVAYTSGGGKEFSFVLTDILHIPFSSSLGSVIFLLIFGSIIYLGYRIVEKVNLILFISMIAAYVCMIGLAPKEINIQLLERQDWSINNLFFVMPLMLTTFSFPGIVPTIVPYLNRDVKAIRMAIIGGTSLTFIVYFIWLLIVLGTVSNEGPHGLQDALLCDVPATECLHYAIQNPIFSYIAQFFAFFALTTSFLGIALALFDFLSDGFGISKKGNGKLTVNLLIALPVLFFSIYFQRAFITALELTGGIGDSLISGLIPALMIWKGRYKLGKQSDYQVIGGKPLLVFICLFSLSILACEVLRRVVS
jgi:tyrosine-specific transport protein